MTGRPLVLLDVDGVLSLGLTATSKFRARMMFHEGRHWHSGWAGDDRYSGTRIFLDRRWGPMVRSIAEAGAELAWGSRWEGAANDCIGPLLGLPELPWAPANTWDPREYDEGGSPVMFRKAVSVVPWTAGRPWAWLEDDQEELALASALADPGVPFLPVAVNPRQGLHEEDVKEVIAWLGRL